MNRKARQLILATLIVAAWSIPGITTPAAAESLSCTAEGDLVITPGLSTSPSSGTYGSDQPGTLDCKGGMSGTVQPGGSCFTRLRRG